MRIKSLLLSLVLGLSCADSATMNGGPPMTMDSGSEPADMGFVSIDSGGNFTESDAGVIDCGDKSQCGVLCVDFQSDPDNCGACGRTCVIPQATAGCSMGECEIESCDLGYYDQDQDVSNGCEFADNCVADEACMTSCQTTGTTACLEGVLSCTPPAEVCNASDDDCDGQCDEGSFSGCRNGVHRGYGNGHVYSDDISFVETSPYHVEFRNYFYLYTQSVPGTRPLFLCRKSDNKRLLTTRTDCEMNGAMERQIGFLSPTEICGAVPLYQLLHEPSNNHFYTVSASERDNATNNLSYTLLGIIGYVWSSESG